MPRGRKKYTTEQLITVKEEQMKKLQQEITNLNTQKDKEAMQKLMTVIKQKNFTIDKAVEIINKA